MTLFLHIKSTSQEESGPRASEAAALFRATRQILRLLVCLFSLAAAPFFHANAQGELASGASHTGAIANPGDESAWTFSSEPGQRVFVRVSQSSGGNSLVPRLRIFDAEGSLVGTQAGAASSTTSSARLDYLSSESGPFTLIVDGNGGDGTGSFRIDFLTLPGAPEVPSGETGGPLDNEGRHEGNIALGDLDIWTVTAAANEWVELRLAQLSGDAGFVPRMRVYDSTGTPIAEALGATASQTSEARARFKSDEGGEFTVVVDSNTPEGSGNYRLHRLSVPAEISIPASDQGGPLENGANHDGSISLADTDAWTFEAEEGSRILLRAAQTSGDNAFTPRLRIFDGNGQMVATATGAAGTTAAEARVEFIAAESSPHTVLIDAAVAEGTGGYRLFYLKLPGDVSTPAGDDGAALAAGQNHDGNAGLGDLDVWTFEASAGDRITLNISQLSGGQTFSPRVRVFASTGVLLGHAFTSDASANSAAEWKGVLPLTGSYNVVVDSGLVGGAGSYRLTYAHEAGPITLPPTSGPALINGGNVEGELLAGGDSDNWTFQAGAGDWVMLRAARLTGHTTWFRPWVRVLGPDGEVVAEGDASDNADNGVTIVVEESATYQVAISSFYPDYAGTYRLHFLNLPGEFTTPGGDDGGPLTNGGNHEATITPGDIDAWSFEAEAGDRVLLRAARLSGHATWFRPWIRLIGPDGSLIGAGDAGDNADNQVTAIVPQTGTYAVVMSSYYTGYDGTYRLHFAKIPGEITVPGGDDGGALTNGGIHEGTITPSDFDIWSFEAGAGEQIILRASRLTGHATWFRPHVQLFGPDGSLIAAGDAQDNHDNEISWIAKDSAIYRVVVNSYYSGYDGTYRLYYVRIPGEFTVPGADEGGPLTNGGNHEGTLNVGEMDSWSFEGHAGDRVIIRAGRLTGHATWFRPWVRLYGPDGRLVLQGDAQDNHDNGLNAVLSQSATYHVLTSSYYTGYEGTYRLHFLHLPEEFSVPGADEGGPLTNGGNHEGAITIGDLDAWRFEAEAGDRILLRAGQLTGHATWFRPVIDLYGPNGIHIASGNAQQSHDNMINLTVEEAATYVAVISSYYSGYDGTYRLHCIQVPEVFQVPGGDDGGALAADSNPEGTLTIGDLDVWTFEASEGSAISLTMEAQNTTRLSPTLEIYGPTGERLAMQNHRTAAEISLIAPDGGIFVVVASSGATAETGSYRLTNIVIPEQGKQLRYARTQSGSYTLNWPHNLAGHILQQSATMQPDSWEDVEAEPINNGLNIRVTVPLPPGEEDLFFRLRPAE